MFSLNDRRGVDDERVWQAASNDAGVKIMRSCRSEEAIDFIVEDEST
ncbi:hypothetical protein [Deinococcus pimensis]|nr:hypothetical protein [Deinococcus pimensis]